MLATDPPDTDHATDAAPGSAPVGEAKTPPVIMVGPWRAGTTMLRLMLDAHPALNFFCEMEYATLGAVGDAFPDVADYRRMLALDRMYHIRAFPIDESLSHRDLVRSFMDSGRGVAPDKPHVGVTIHHRIDLLPRLWPEAKYLHVLRDPRDVARSTIGMGWSGNVYHGAKLWKEAELQYNRLVAQVPDAQRYEVRFEDVVENPEKHWRGICEWIGVDFDPAMHTYHHGTTYEPPDPKLTYQWKRKLTDRQAQQVEAVVGDLLTSRGYEPSGLPKLELTALRKNLWRIDHALRRDQMQRERYGFGFWLSRKIARCTGPQSWRDAIQRRVNQRDTELLR